MGVADGQVADAEALQREVLSRPVMRLLDAIDRARLTTMDLLVLLHVAEAEATVEELAERLDRRPADVRRATARLAARGLLRRRSERTGPRGLTFKATVAGLDVLRRVGLESTLAVTCIPRRS